MKKKIMIVDDDENEHILLKHLIKNTDYEIISAISGKQCIQLLEQENLPDIMLLDISFPKINGWEIYDIIKENDKWKKIPIIFISGRSDRRARDMGEYLGDGFIQKPIQKNDLIKLIENILNNK